jgi:hypothetical protein
MLVGMSESADGHDLPTSGRHQSCALCDATPVLWVHPLDRAQLHYREYGKGHTLPTFWTTCGSCEVLVMSGDDDALIERMKQSGRFRPEITHWSPEDEAEVLRKPLSVFRRADLGSRPLPETE